MPSEELLFRDGLGDRFLVRDNRGRPIHESLVLRTELSSVPAFEFALNERLWLVERFHHPAFLPVRNIVHAPGRLPLIGLESDYTAGVRLSDVLVRAESSRQPLSAGVACFVIQEILHGLAHLHRQSGDLAHGALAPERIVLADCKVRIADWVLGTAIEQLRYSTERYWKELRVAIPASAGGVRLDRRVDVAQVGMIAIAMFASRPLRDGEHIGALADLLMITSLPAPIRSWLLKALHMDPRRVFVSASEASQSLGEAMAEAGVQPAPQDMNLQSVNASRALPVLVPPAPAIAHAPTVEVAPAAKPVVTVATWKPNCDLSEAHKADPETSAPQGTSMRDLMPVRPEFKKFLRIGIVIAAMTGMFTAAQFIPVPDWLYSRAGTLVVESNPQGVQVLVNGKLHGVTPLTLRVEGGLHEVELRGPGKPKIFKVFVSRGDRVAQYVEFPMTRRR
jgi:serine/threonine protein kinase